MLLLAREPKNEVINIKQVHRLTIKHLYTNCKQVRLNIGLGKGYMPSCSHKNNPQTGEPQTANPSRNKVRGEGAANPYQLRSSNTWNENLDITWNMKRKKDKVLMLKCYIKPPPIKLYLCTMAVAGEYLIGSAMVPLRYSFIFGHHWWMPSKPMTLWAAG